MKLRDSATAVVLVESEKASLALTDYARRAGTNLVAVAMGGCWGWRGRIGKATNARGVTVDERGPLPDLDCVNGHKTFVLMDSNVATNAHVQQARAALIRELVRRDCQAMVCDLPIMDGVNGPDDYIAVCGDSAMTEVFSNATTVGDGNWRALFHTYEEFLNAPPLRFAINGFLQEAGITLIGGLSGHGKTLVMLSMVRALLEQTPLFQYNLFQVPRPAERVLYLVPESAIGPFYARIKMFQLDEHLQNDRLLVQTLSSKEQVSLIDPRILKAAEGADIFLDTAVRFMDGAEDAEDSKVFANKLFRLLAVGARTITGAHHSPKNFESQDYMTLENILRGSGDLGAMLCTAWGLRQIDAETNQVYVQNVKPRDFQPCPQFVIEGRPHLDEIGHFKVIEPPGTAGEMRDYLRNKGGAPATPNKGEKLQRVLEMHAQGASLQVIAKAIGISKSGVRKWLKEHKEACTNRAPAVHGEKSSTPDGENNTKGVFLGLGSRALIPHP